MPTVDAEELPKVTVDDCEGSLPSSIDAIRFVSVPSLAISSRYDSVPDYPEGASPKTPEMAFNSGASVITKN